MPDITLPDLDIIGIAAIITGIGVITLAVRKTNRFFRRGNEFFDDWYGSAGDSNHPATPGVLARMASIDSSLSSHIEEENALIKAVAEEVAELKKQVERELGRQTGSTTNAAHEALRVVKEVQVQQEAEIANNRDWHKRYDSDRVASEKRLMVFLALVRRMITLPQDEQVALWDKATEAFNDGSYPDLMKEKS